MSEHDHTPVVHEHADAWHHHSTAEGLPQHEHAGTVNTGSLMKWFAGIVISLVVVIIALSMYFQRFKTELRVKGVETIVSSTEANKRRTEAEKALGLDAEGRPAPEAQYQYTVADKKAKTVHIPISKAKELVVLKYKQPAPIEPAKK